MTAATVETAIWQALKARVAALPSPVNFPVAWPDENFTPPVDGNGRPIPYIEVFDNSNEPERLLISSTGPVLRMGILGIHLMFPVAMARSHAVKKQYAGQIAAWFPTDLKMISDGVTVQVEKPPKPPSIFRDDAYWRCPVQVRWLCFA